MKSAKKTFVFCIVTLVIMSFMGISTQAANNNEVIPLWDNTAVLNVGIYFLDDGYGYAEVATTGQLGTNKIVSEVKVYRQYGSFWILVAEEANTTYGGAAVLTCQFTPINGTYYKAVFTVTVTKDNVDETITKTVYRTNN